MPIRSRLSLAAALLSALAALFVLTGPGDAAAVPKIPKIPKVPHFVDRHMMVSASGTITYRWTYDSRQKCVPGYTKTVEEEFRFNSPKRAMKMSITPGLLIAPALRGGEGQLDVRLGNWATSNFCDPNKPAPEPPMPTCKSGPTGLALAIAAVPTELEREELAPLSREAWIAIQRTKAVIQDPDCARERPDIVYEPEDEADEFGWYVDPRAGFATGLHATTMSFASLGVGATLKRRIEFDGGCGGATAHASGAATIPSNITRCTISGVVFVNVTRVR